MIDISAAHCQMGGFLEYSSGWSIVPSTQATTTSEGLARLALTCPGVPGLS